MTDEDFEQAARQMVEEVRAISPARSRLANAELRALDAIRDFGIKSHKLEVVRSQHDAAPEAIYAAAQAKRDAEAEANKAIGALMTANVDVAVAEGEL